MKKENKTKQIEKSRSFDFRNKWTSGILLILLATFLLFSPAIQYDFVNWDDPVNVFENKNVTEFNVKEIFSNPVIGGYNPLTILTFAIDYKISEGKPWIFHLNNIILHLLCTFLVFTFLRKLEFSFFVTFLVTLLFGLHPLRVESVVWITERKDVLFGFFFLLSLIFYTDYIKTNKRFLYIISLLLFILSLLSKIQAVALPLVLFLIDYLLVKKTNLKSILEKIPFFILSLITGLVGIYFLKQDGSLVTEGSFSSFERIFVGSYSLIIYLLKAIFPFQMAAYHPNLTIISTIQYLSLLPALALILLIFFLYKRYRQIVFGILFFMFNIVFVLQIIGAGQGFLADRFTYIPYIGIFLLFSIFAVNLINKFRTQKVLIYSILAIYILILSLKTKEQRNTWKNSETLWKNVINIYPEHSMPYFGLGEYYKEIKDDINALDNYNSAIQIEPNNKLALNNRANIWFNQNNYDKAIDDYNACLGIDPDFIEPLTNRGIAYSRKEEWNLALKDLDRTLEFNPKLLAALSNRAYVYSKRGNFEKAIEDYQNYLKINPNSPDIINSIGLIYNQKGDYEKAVSQFNICIEMNSNQPVYFINRSIAFYNAGDKEKALKDAIRARDLGFNVDNDYLNNIQNQ